MDREVFATGPLSVLLGIELEASAQGKRRCVRSRGDDREARRLARHLTADTNRTVDEPTP
jgi:hypothetical protein